MAQVGVKRLAPGHRQEDRAQDGEGHAWMTDQEACPPDRIDRPKNARSVGNMQDPQPRERQEPKDADRAEQACHPRGPAALHGKQRHQDADRDRRT